MTRLLVVTLVALAAVLIVAAVVFRSQRAVEILRFLRKVGWGYVIGILLLAAIAIWRNGGL